MYFFKGDKTIKAVVRVNVLGMGDKWKCVSSFINLDKFNLLDTCVKKNRCYEIELKVTRARAMCDMLHGGK